MDAALLQELFDLCLKHKWIAVAALVIGWLIRMSKEDVKFLDVPGRWRPFVALALGQVSGVLEMAMAGKPWKEALAGGVVSTIGAIAGHAFLVKWLAGGKELSIPGLMRALPERDLPSYGTGTVQIDSSKVAEIVARKGPPPMPPGAAVMMLALALAAPFSGGCAAIAAALPQILSVVTDSMLVLDSIDRFVDAFFVAHPNPEQRERFVKAMAKARAALIAAKRATEGVQELTQEQYDAAFKDFEAAYLELLEMAGPFGVRQDPGTDRPLLAPGPGGKSTLTVPAPKAIRYKVQR